MLMSRKIREHHNGTGVDVGVVVGPSRIFDSFDSNLVLAHVKRGNPDHIVQGAQKIVLFDQLNDSTIRKEHSLWRITVLCSLMQLTDANDAHKTTNSCFTTPSLQYYYSE